MSPRAYGLALALLWGCVACCATTVRSGRPPQQVPPGYDERWHSEFFWGVVAAAARPMTWLESARLAGRR